MSAAKTDTAATELNADQAVEILTKILDQLQSPEIVKKLDEARDNVGNEMLKMMQFVFPIVMQTEMEVIREFGFAEGREGIIKFATALRALEREDGEVARLHSVIKSYYLPPVGAAGAAVPSAPPECSPVGEERPL